MRYKGHVENGVIVLEENVKLPDGITVYVDEERLPAGGHHPDVEKFAGILANHAEDLADYRKHLSEKYS